METWIISSIRVFFFTFSKFIFGNIYVFQTTICPTGLVARREKEENAFNVIESASITHHTKLSRCKLWTKPTRGFMFESSLMRCFRCRFDALRSLTPVLGRSHKIIRVRKNQRKLKTSQHDVTATIHFCTNEQNWIRHVNCHRLITVVPCTFKSFP